MKRSWRWLLPVLLITAGVAVGLIAPPLALPHGVVPVVNTTASPTPGAAMPAARAAR